MFVNTSPQQLKPFESSWASVCEHLLAWASLITQDFTAENIVANSYVGKAGSEDTGLQALLSTII